MTDYRKEYYQKNKEKYLAYQKEYNKMRRRKDPMFRLNGNISRSINYSLQGNKSGLHWETLVSYTAEQLKEHLEKQFQLGMTWSNYGKWHIDHIIPKSLWKFEKPEDREFQQCWALANLQPLWAEENIKKRAKL